MQHVPRLFDTLYALTILSDRQKGLIEGVEIVFPLAAHGYCLKHLERNLKLKHNHPELIKLLWKAASARSRGFRKAHVESQDNQSACIYLAYE